MNQEKGLAKLTVIGNGAWATTIANHLAKNVTNLVQWCYSEDRANQLNETKVHDKLPTIQLKKNHTCTANLAEAIAGTQGIVFCVPARFAKQTIEQLIPLYKPQTPFLNLTKGIFSESFLLLADYLNQRLNQCNYAVLSGPNLALEIAEQKPAASVVAAKYSQTAVFFQQLLNHSNFRIYTSDDTIGVACGGLLKNIYAIAAGCIDALDLGSNTKATLITRCVPEMMLFGKKLGATVDTFYGLSGIGDLMATCNSSLSRNYQCGWSLAKGMTLQEFETSLNAVAEGIHTTKYIYDYSKNNQIEMPITQAVYDMMYNNVSIKMIIKELMNRETKKEQL